MSIRVYPKILFILLKSSPSLIDLFIGKILHDLINPINAIGLSLEVLFDSPQIDPHVCKIIQQSYQNLVKSIEIYRFLSGPIQSKDFLKMHRYWSEWNPLVKLSVSNQQDLSQWKESKFRLVFGLGLFMLEGAPPSAEFQLQFVPTVLTLSKGRLRDSYQTILNSLKFEEKELESSAGLLFYLLKLAESGGYTLRYQENLEGFQCQIL
jgi:hypothetical protein